MKRSFSKPLSLIFLLAMLLSLTGVAEDGGTVGANAIDTSTAGITSGENEMGEATENDLEGEHFGVVLLNDDDLPELELKALPLDVLDIDLSGGNQSGEGDSFEEISVDDSADIVVKTEEKESDQTETTDTNKTAVPKALKLGKGEKYTLNVNNATYISSKKSVATVNRKGVITAVKTGSAKITVKSGKKIIGTCKVTVVKAPSKVTVKPKKLMLPRGTTYALKISFPTKTASKKLTWKSSNKKVAIVDANGVVKGIKAGTANITVTTYNKKKAICKVTVVKNPVDDFVIKKGVITGYKGKGGDIVIPTADVKGNPVTAIGKAAFKGNKKITSVTIQSGITKIGAQAFKGCKKLESVTYPNGLQSMGDGVFQDCKKLKQVLVSK